MGIKSENKDFSLQCPECGGYIISIQSVGETVCSQCGLVINEKIIDTHNNGRRAFTNSERESREQTGSPVTVLVPDIGMSTVMDKKGITNPDLKRAAKWNTRLTWESRNMLIATTELKRISSNLTLPEYVKEEAMKLYREAFKRKLLQGRSINAMVAACLYYSLRNKEIPRTMQEILDESSETSKNVKRAYVSLIKELKLKVPSTNPLSLIPRYINELGLEIEIEDLVNRILEQYLKSFSIMGKDPKGICAGALYLACKIKNIEITQKDITNVVGVTEITLRSRYKEIVKQLNIK